MPIKTQISQLESCTILHMETSGGLADPADLAELRLPESLLTRRHLGLVLSGRMPVWVYACVAGMAHTFAWLATYDPRLNGAVVVQRHVATAPELGAVLPLPVPERQDKEKLT